MGDLLLKVVADWQWTLSMKLLTLTVNSAYTVDVCISTDTGNIFWG